ncbi:polysaccharide biosynthesis/export family protein [Mucilaginibacter kameinonensis]|uniref:polysaccharide biosynthesis/export family protein n=1 Tax=Mucilaginibacter kameinonensis TaxID=452286 RepID=UPI000EF7A082|nr:polysaccharide biosynthesis/export family protein [Mucilaginibacter kameinonensis]
MRKASLINSSLFLFILFVFPSLFSCNATKKVKYFQDIPDSGQVKHIESAVYAAPQIKIDDILTIVIQTIDPTATASLNLGNINSTSAGIPLGSTINPAQAVTAGYLVDKEGNVDIATLGKIKVAGLTTFEAKNAILQIADKYFKNSSVSVRFANFKISVTGEVNRPSTYIIPNEKVSILDALSLAGDMTIFGKRDNVLLIRENEDGSRITVRMNLKKSNIMSSPYFYLRQNDVVYVEPSSSKAAATDASQARYYTLVGSLLSVLIVLFTRK